MAEPRRRGCAPDIRLPAGAACIAALFACGGAQAQEIPMPAPDDLIFQEPQPQGVRLGGFTLLPAIGLDTEYDDNIFNRARDRVSDAIGVLRPSARLASNWARHSLTVDADAEIARYAGTPSENSEQYHAGYQGRLDLGDDLTVNASAGVAQRIEPRGTFGDLLGADGPVTYHELDTRIGVRQPFNRLAIQAGAAVTRIRYDDLSVGGVPVDQGYRDYRKVTLTSRADFAFSHRSAVFVRTSFNNAHYLQRLGPDRDSRGFSIVGGFGFRFSTMFNAEIGVGYIHQSYDNRAFREINGVDYHVNAQWSPTRRILIRANAGRSVERSPLPDVASVLHSQVRLDGSYALTDKWQVGAELDWVGDDFDGIDRVDSRVRGSLTTRYLIGRHFSLFGEAGYRDQSSTGADGRRYHGVALRAGIRAAL